MHCHEHIHMDVEFTPAVSHSNVVFPRPKGHCFTDINPHFHVITVVGQSLLVKVVSFKNMINID